MVRWMRQRAPHFTEAQISHIRIFRLQTRWKTQSNRQRRTGRRLLHVHSLIWSWVWNRLTALRKNGQKEDARRPQIHCDRCRNPGNVENSSKSTKADGSNITVRPLLKKKLSSETQTNAPVHWSYTTKIRDKVNRGTPQGESYHRPLDNRHKQIWLSKAVK